MTRSGCLTAYAIAIAPPGNPEERESIEPGCVNDGFEIANPRIEAHIGHVTLGHAIATLVVAHEPMVSERARYQWRQIGLSHSKSR